MSDYYFLAIEATNLHLALKLNGAPLIENNEGTGIVTSKPIATWLLQGENQLELALFALPGEDRIRGSLKVTVYLHDSASDAPKPKKIYASIIYPNEKNLPQGKIDHQILTFDFPHKIPGKLWDEAEKLNTLSPTDQQEIVDLVNALTTALSKKDAQSAIDLQMYKVNDDAAAEGKPPERLVKATMFNYQWLLGHDNLIAKPFEKEDAHFAILETKQVVHVTRKGGENAVKMEADDSRFEIPIYVSKIKGTWTIVR